VLHGHYRERQVSQLGAFCVVFIYLVDFGCGIDARVGDFYLLSVSGRFGLVHLLTVGTGLFTTSMWLTRERAASQFKIIPDDFVPRHVASQ
jgi:hypothetical protein